MKASDVKFKRSCHLAAVLVEIERLTKRKSKAQVEYECSVNMYDWLNPFKVAQDIASDQALAMHRARKVNT
jgi:hypothetical protein